MCDRTPSDYRIGRFLRVVGLCTGDSGKGQLARPTIGNLSYLPALIFLELGLRCLDSRLQFMEERLAAVTRLGGGWPVAVSGMGGLLKKDCSHCNRLELIGAQLFETGSRG